MGLTMGVCEPEFALHPRGDGPRWRSNPHNPSGLLAGPAETAAVWDEAFYPLATGRWTRGDPGAVVVGSLTKLLACPGTGIDDQVLAVKTHVVTRAVARLAPRADPLDVLAEVGGLEIAALAGFIVAGAAAGVPVMLDGVIAGAAALIAAAFAPDVVDYLLAGHRSSEPGARAALEHLALVPVLDLDLRLGEGSGAALAIPLVQAAAKILREMATFDSAGVTDKNVAGR